MTSAILSRGIIRISGPDASGFLQGLLTCDMDKITPDSAGFGALLSPQGKILFDFFVYATQAGFLLDCRHDMAAELAKRLGFYKLRAKVVIENLTGTVHVQASWGEGPLAGWTDPRSAQAGTRAVLPGPGTDNAAAAALYAEWRIRNGLAEGGVDYVYGDIFPHEANLDRTGGVDFQKGCYVGQEVVSRMQHKTIVRKRVVPVQFSGAPLAVGTEVTAGELNIGRMGSSIAGLGLALLRLDRVADARASGTLLMADRRNIEVL